jgi:hypothetical protein
MSAEQLSPAQMFFIGLLEDARVEYKAVNEFPGFNKLWRSLIMLEQEETGEHKTMSILEGYALQLLDENEKGNDEQLNKFAAKFDEKSEANHDDNHFAWLMGVEPKLAQRRNPLKVNFDNNSSICINIGRKPRAAVDAN